MKECPICNKDILTDNYVLLSNEAVLFKKNKKGKILFKLYLRIHENCFIKNFKNNNYGKIKDINMYTIHIAHEEFKKTCY